MRNHASPLVYSHHTQKYKSESKVNSMIQSQLSPVYHRRIVRNKLISNDSLVTLLSVILLEHHQSPIYRPPPTPTLPTRYIIKAYRSYTRACFQQLLAKACTISQQHIDQAVSITHAFSLHSITSFLHHHRLHYHHQHHYPNNSTSSSLSSLSSSCEPIHNLLTGKKRLTSDIIKADFLPL